MESNSNNEKNISEIRKDKVRNFHMNISNDDLAVGDRYRELENLDVEASESINSYSDDVVREKMEKNSRTRLKAEKKELKKQMKYNDRQNRRVFRLIWWVSVGFIGMVIGMFIMVGVSDMLAMNRTDNKTVSINIPANPTLDQVADELKAKGAINETKFFNMYATFTHNTEFSQGKYKIPANLDYEAIITYLQSLSNRVDTIKVTIPEGMNVREIAKLLVKKKVLSDSKHFLELCNSDYFDEDYSFLAREKNQKKRYYKLEGYLFPDTYECYVNERPEQTITRMLDDYEVRVYTEQNVDGYSKAIRLDKLVKKSKYSMDQILTIASIIQAEAATTDDMYYISSVLHNRLDADINEGVGMLSLDSTQYYPYRSKKDVPASKRKTFKSRYSTYNKVGLPPGPINNPGMKAILAALYPNDTDYLYFCHDKKGKPYYASSLWEHEYNLSLIED